VLFTLVCAFATWLVYRYNGLRMGQAAWGMISYYMVLTVLLHAWQEGNRGISPQVLVRRYMAGLAIKMFLSLMVLVLLLFLLPREAVLHVVLTFILLYLAYLGFSTARMTMVLRRGSQG